MIVEQGNENPKKPARSFDDLFSQRFDGRWASGRLLCTASAPDRSRFSQGAMGLASVPSPTYALIGFELVTVLVDVFVEAGHRVLEGLLGGPSGWMQPRGGLQEARGIPGHRTSGTSLHRHGGASRGACAPRGGVGADAGEGAQPSWKAVARKKPPGGVLAAGFAQENALELCARRYGSTTLVEDIGWDIRPGVPESVRKLGSIRAHWGSLRLRMAAAGATRY